MPPSAGSAVFEWVCGELARKGVMSELEARGTVRLLVKEAGLSPSSIQKAQMAIVVSRLLRRQLQLRKVPDAARIAEEISAALARAKLDEARGPEAPEDVFARLGIGKG